MQQHSKLGRGFPPVRSPTLLNALAALVAVLSATTASPGEPAGSCYESVLSCERASP